MLGQELFYWVNKRLMQVTQIEEDFGGLSLILTGDIWQLPPVLQKNLFDNDVRKFENKIALDLYNSFEEVYVLDSIMRQDKTDSKNIRFKKVLNNIRIGEVHKEDWEFLRSLFKINLNINKFIDYTFLFTTNNEVRLHNLNCLENCKGALFKIEANDSHIDLTYSDESFLGNLQYRLYLKLGCKVSLIENISVKNGLVNGSEGVLKDIIFKNRVPVILLIKFECYSEDFIIDSEKIVPIFLSDREHEHYFDKQRTQFPIRLSYASTIHKSQGSTIKKVVLDAGKNEFSPGLLYVGLSRVRDVDDLVLFPFSFERFEKICKSKSFKDRKIEWERILSLSK